MTVVEGPITLEVSSNTITSIDLHYGGNLKVEKYIGGTIVYNIGTNACYQGNIVELDISDTEIRKIDMNAFCLCLSLRAVHLPESIIELEGNSFGATSIESFYVPSRVEVFSGFTLNQCLLLDTITVNETNQFFTSINNFVFTKSLSTLVRSPIHFEQADIPLFDGIQNIGYCPFSGANIHRFVASSNLSSISSRLFCVCRYIKYIDLSKSSITELPSKTFEMLDVVHMIILPTTLTTIRNNAFLNCPKLSKIVLPPLISSIEVNAFSSLNSLQSIYSFSITSFPSPNIFFDVTITNIVVYVPRDYQESSFGGARIEYDVYDIVSIELFHIGVCTSMNQPNMPFNFSSCYLFVAILLYLC